jgi:arsenate reductase
MVRKKILFICTNNSARSQMAEALLNSDFAEQYEAYSAGTKPTNVDPHAIDAMKELGMDISHHRAKSIEEFKGKEFDIVVTVCDNAKEECPLFLGAKNTIHRSFKDPAQEKGTHEEIQQAFRRARDEIRTWITQELVRMGNGEGPDMKFNTRQQEQ